MNIRRAAVAAPLTMFASGAAGLGYAWWEARNFTVRRYDMPVLPVGAPDIRVLHLSDLHVLPRQHRKLKWLGSLGELRPDLVVSTGDNLSGPDSIPALLAAHGSLLNLPGVFVLGSNDYFAPTLKNPMRYLRKVDGGSVDGVELPTDDLVKGFVGAGWTDLTHRRQIIEVRGVPLEFLGVDDPHIHRDRYDLVAGPPDSAAVASIGVVHAPYRRVLDAMAADRLNLILAGHTHGGQLRVPFHGALTTNCDLPKAQARGVSHWDESWLHVCAGAGTPPWAAIRFACRPEAVLLTLTSAR